MAVDLSNLSDGELAALRERLTELGSDLPGTLAALPPEVRRQYRNAERSIIEARDRAPFEIGHKFIR